PDQLMRGRYAIFNVWRPTNGPAEQWRLAVCDMQSMTSDDFVDAELRWPHRTGHACAGKPNPSHRWLYTPALDVVEVPAFKRSSPATQGGTARFGAHTAFADPTSPDGARTRESIEVRTIALFCWPLPDARGLPGEPGDSWDRLGCSLLPVDLKARHQRVE